MKTPIQYYSDFIGISSTADIDSLWRDIDWEQREAPRRECWMNDFGMDYTYGSGRGERTYGAKEWFPLAKQIQVSLAYLVGDYFQGCFINGYESERQHLGWHSDDSPEMDDSKHIAVLSFGAERKIYFRPKGEKGPATEEVVMEHGSLLLMKPGMQNDWVHRIPKHTEPCGPRVSFTYRGILK